MHAQTGSLFFLFFWHFQLGLFNGLFNGLFFGKFYFFLFIAHIYIDIYASKFAYNAHKLCDCSAEICGYISSRLFHGHLFGLHVQIHWLFFLCFGLIKGLIFFRKLFFAFRKLFGNFFFFALSNLFSFFFGDFFDFFRTCGFLGTIFVSQGTNKLIAQAFDFSQLHHSANRAFIKCLFFAHYKPPFIPSFCINK